MVPSVINFVIGVSFYRVAQGKFCIDLKEFNKEFYDMEMAVFNGEQHGVPMLSALLYYRLTFVFDILLWRSICLKASYSNDLAGRVEL